MSNKLKHALRASMESDEVPVAQSLDAAIEENNSIDLSGPTAAELHDHIESTNNVIEVLDDIGIAAQVVKVPEEDGTVINPEVEGEVIDSVAVGAGGGMVDAPVSMEALAYTLHTVLRSHGVTLSASSLESGADQGQRVAALAHSTATNLRRELSVALENATADMRSSLIDKNSAITKTKAALAQAIAKINASSKSIDQSPITLTHRGINQFLFRDGEPVLELKDAMKGDLAVMEKLKKAVLEMGSIYDHLYTSDDVGETNVKKFVAGLAKLHTGAIFNGLDSETLLNGGMIHRAEEEESPYIFCEYNFTTNDGNWAQRHANKIGATIGAAAGAAGGAALGGVVIGLGGAFVGGVAGAMAGKALGEIGNGRNTHSTNSPADLVAFLKDAMTMCDMVKGLSDLLGSVESADKRARQYATTLASSLTSTNDTLKVVGVNILVGVLSAAVAHKTGRGLGPTGAGGMKTEAETIRETMMGLIDGNYEGYHSLAVTLIDHVFLCVDAAAKMAKNVIDNV